MKTSAVYLAVAFAVICAFVAHAPTRAAWGAERGAVPVLALDSRGATDPWGADLLSGLARGLGAREDVRLRVEHMGTDTVYDGAHVENLRQLYAHKYRDARVEVVVASGPRAFEFARAFGPVLWPGAPVFFAGLPVDAEAGAAMASAKGVPGGVGMGVDARATVEFMRTAHPGLGRVVLIGAQGMDAGPGVIAEAKAALRGMDGLAVEYAEAPTLSIALERVRALKAGDAVLLGLVPAGWAGALARAAERPAAPGVSETPGVPVYALFAHDVRGGAGVVGGVVADGRAHGADVAAMVMGLLGGKPEAGGFRPGPAPGGLYQADALHRFGVARASLPWGSAVISSKSDESGSAADLPWWLLAIVLAEACVIGWLLLRRWLANA